MSHTDSILIVDDDPRFCESLKGLLSDQDYKMQTSNSGKEAVECLAKNSFDLALLDIVLPDMNGHQLMDYINSQTPETLVIVITGHASIESAIESLRKGGYDYLRKPFEPDELSTTVKNALDKKRLKRDSEMAKEALRESEKRYRLLFEHSPIGTSLASADGKVISINKAMETITGYSLEELKKINLADTYENPEDRRALLEAINRYGSVVDYPVRLKRKDGTLYDVLLTISRVHHLGSEDLFQTICVDVSKQKQAEEEKKKLETRLQQAQKMEAIATLAGGIAHEFNNTLVGITGNIDLLQMELPDSENISKYVERMKDSTHRMAHLTNQLLAYARGGKYQPNYMSLNKFVEESLPVINKTIDPFVIDNKGGGNFIREASSCASRSPAGRHGQS